MDESILYFKNEDKKNFKAVKKQDEATHVMLSHEAYKDIVRENALLRQIHVEIMNAKHGLSPKKDRSGYYVRSCNEKRSYCMGDGIFGHRIMGRCWEYRVFTPLFIGMDVEDARKEASGFLDGIFGFKKYCETEEMAKKEGEYYFCSDVNMSANTVSGVWEILFTLPEYIPIPKDLYPPSRSSSKRKMKNG